MLPTWSWSREVNTKNQKQKACLFPYVPKQPVNELLLYITIYTIETIILLAWAIYYKPAIWNTFSITLRAAVVQNMSLTLN